MVVEERVKLKELFEAESKSIKQMFIVDNEGYFIPTYQRPYSWDREKVERLFDDILLGTINLIDNSSSITFLGTIIVVDSSSKDNAKKLSRSNPPSTIYGVVDGQQRLTTLLLLITALHDELRLYISDDQLPKNIEKTIRALVGDLQKLFQMDIHNQYDKDLANDYVLYPKLIRVDDKWSDEEEEHLRAVYKSPIAEFLSMYMSHFHNSTLSGNKFEYISSYSNETHDHFSRTFKEIKHFIDKYVKCNDHEDIKFPGINKLIQSLSKTFKPLSNFQESLDEKFTKNYGGLLRLIFFAQFFLERVAITLIKAENEDCAFDMFESLNSTGEPLTAFETFRPKIIQQDQPGSYKNAELADEIADILEKKDKNDKKNYTESLIIAFASAEIGYKLPKKLYMQRSFLREKFNNANKDDKQNFINHLYFVSKFMKHFWFSEDIQEENSKGFGTDVAKKFDEETLVCLEYLRDVKHGVVIPVLSRYYTQILEASDKEKRSEYFSELEEVIKSVTAFSIIWRAYFSGTAGIDSIYRDLVAGKLKIKDVPKIPISRRYEENDRIHVNTELPRASKLKTIFRDILMNHKKTNILNKDIWIQKVADTPIFSKQKDVSKFILLTAFHKSLVNSKNQGELKRLSNRGGNESLRLEIWNDSTFTLEHIAPQNGTFWSDCDIYEDSVTRDKIGNLIYLSKNINSSLSNKPWEEKKKIFDLLSTEDLEEFENKSSQYNLEKKQVDKIKSYGFKSYVSSLAHVESEWNKKFVNNRSKNLLNLSWEILYDNWLG